MAGEKITTAAPTPAAVGVSDESKLFGALCYIIGILVPLFVLFTEKKRDKFLLFHAWQSLIFTVAVIVYIIGLGILGMILGFVFPPLACIVFPLWFLPFLAVLFLAWKTYQGEKYMLPTIGEMANKQAMK